MKKILIFSLAIIHEKFSKMLFVESFLVPPSQDQTECPLSCQQGPVLLGPLSCHSEHTNWTVYFQATRKGALDSWNSSTQLRKQLKNSECIGFLFIMWMTRRRRITGPQKFWEGALPSVLVLPLLQQSSKMMSANTAHKVTAVHSSCPPHNQSFLCTKRPEIHAGFCTVHCASCWPTPHALAPTQRKKEKHGKTALTDGCKGLQAPRWSDHVQFQLWWHLHICDIFL